MRCIKESNKFEYQSKIPSLITQAIKYNMFQKELYNLRAYINLFKERVQWFELSM
jgi:hypothetical protein